jgi:hypothetical protein
MKAISVADLPALVAARIYSARAFRAVHSQIPISAEPGAALSSSNTILVLVFAILSSGCSRLSSTGELSARAVSGEPFLPLTNVMSN